MTNLTKTAEKEESNLSIMLRRGVIIGVIAAGAIIATPPDNTTTNSKHNTTANNKIAIAQVNKNETLGSSFDEIVVLGLITTGITIGLAVLGRKLDKMDD